MAAILGIVTAASIIKGNIILPLIAIALVTAFIATIKMKVTDVISDERDYIVAGKASRIVYLVTTYALVIATIIFASFGKTYSAFFGYSIITVSTGLGMMVLYSITLYYYNKKGE